MSSNETKLVVGDEVILADDELLKAVRERIAQYREEAAMAAYVESINLGAPVTIGGLKFKSEYYDDEAAHWSCQSGDDVIGLVLFRDGFHPQGTPWMCATQENDTIRGYGRTPEEAYVERLRKLFGKPKLVIDVAGTEFNYYPLKSAYLQDGTCRKVYKRGNVVLTLYRDMKDGKLETTWKCSASLASATKHDVPAFVQGVGGTEQRACENMLEVLATDIALREADHKRAISEKSLSPSGRAADAVRAVALCALHNEYDALCKLLPGCVPASKAKTIEVGNLTFVRSTECFSDTAYWQCGDLTLRHSPGRTAGEWFCSARLPCGDVYAAGGSPREAVVGLREAVTQRLRELDKRKADINKRHYKLLKEQRSIAVEGDAAVTACNKLTEALNAPVKFGGDA